jgi:hypothetical protein
MAQTYDSITIQVDEHPSDRGVYVVSALLCRGDYCKSDEPVEIRGARAAAAYAKNGAEFWQQIHPTASVVAIDHRGREIWSK